VVAGVASAGEAFVRVRWTARRPANLTRRESTSDSCDPVEMALNDPS
jgi:hypothetical protein